MIARSLLEVSQASEALLAGGRRDRSRQIRRRFAPEAAIPDPEAFLALLDTEVYWDVA